MRWRDGRRSTNIEDRRGLRVGRRAIGGGLGTIILALIALYFGIDPSIILQQNMQVDTGPSQTTAPYEPTEQEKQLAEFVSVVLADTEDVWKNIFHEMGRQYEEPKLVLFSGMVNSACGLAQAAMGPFYCPMDHKVYIDLSFYNELKHRIGAPGDFAQAYVIAHEVGHHVQNLFGILPKVHQLRQRLSRAEANRLSVRLELQADCFAGVWANRANRLRNILEPGDIEEALNAASAIGDDRLQKQSRGYVTPDSFTHGTSAQRVRWFKRGFEHGGIEACDTFETDQL